MENQEWDRLIAQRRELDRALARRQILLSEWFAATDPILHRMGSSLDEAKHPFTVDDIRQLEQRRVPPPRVARVLVVRRYRDAREETEKMLRPLSCDIVTAGDGLEALVELAFGQFDLVITGSVLPHLSGVELINLKDALGIDTPAIMHTLMPLGLAAGLAFEIPLPTEDCLCAGNVPGESLELMKENVLDCERRLIVRVKHHLAERGKLSRGSR